MLFLSHDGAEHRSKRLTRATTVFCEISGLTFDQADHLIASMMDDHGRLEVSWRFGPPSTRQREAFATAWKLVGESGENVKHFTAE